MCDVDELAHFIEKETGRETLRNCAGRHPARWFSGALRPYSGFPYGRLRYHLLLAGYGGRCVGISNEQLVHHDIIDAIENMKRPFKLHRLDCAKLY